MLTLRTLLLCVATAQVVHAAEPLSHAQRRVKNVGSVLQYAIPASALALTWIEDPRPVPSDAAGHSAFLLMGGSPRHDLLLALARNWVATVGLKYSVDETRPNGQSRSFPSGHTSLSFAGAEFIRKEYGWRWAAPAYVAAGFVGWSRVEAKKHYTHDVLAGAALGILANHDFWLRRDASGEARLFVATLQSGGARVPGIRLEWSH
jgi:hypothetical protein